MAAAKLNYSALFFGLCISVSSLLLQGCGGDKNASNNNQPNTPDQVAPDTDQPAGQQVGSLRLIGEYIIPTKTMFNAVEFGGISGIDRDADGSYWAVSDDRGGERGAPRFYKLDINLDTDKIHHVNIKQMHYLRDQEQNFLPANRRTVDPESIRVAPNGNLYISSEGIFSNQASALYQPFIREYSKTGHFVREFVIPKMFNYVDNASTGARNNKVFESLTVTPKGMLFAAMEDALIQDGPISSLKAGSVLRVLKLDPQTGQTTAQYAYQLPPIPVDALGQRFAPDNGLSEMLALNEHEFIAVERAFADGVGNTIRLVKTQINPSTTDISQIDSLINAHYEPMSKSVLLDMPIHYAGIKLDNIEGITWGPRLKNGHRSLILVADNNFLDQQSTQFIAFEVLPTR